MKDAVKFISDMIRSDHEEFGVIVFSSDKDNGKELTKCLEDRFSAIISSVDEVETWNHDLESKPDARPTQFVILGLDRANCASLARAMTTMVPSKIIMFMGNDPDPASISMMNTYFASMASSQMNIPMPFGNTRIISMKPGSKLVKEKNIASSEIKDKLCGKKVLIKRTGGLGDVLMLTPVIKALKEKCDGKIDIKVATMFRAALAGNKDVSGIITSQIEQKRNPPESFDAIIDLDAVYRDSSEGHTIDLFADRVLGGTDIDKSIVFSETKKEKEVALSFLRDYKLIGRKLATLHMGVGAKNRTIPPAVWDVMIGELSDMGYEIALVGMFGDFSARKDNVKDMRGYLSLGQIKTVIDNSAVFVGNDSGLVQVAATTDTPIIGFYTIVKPEFRMPYRNGVLGHKFVPLNSEATCFGCTIDNKVAFNGSCGVNTWECCKKFSKDAIVAALDKVEQMK